MRFSLDVVRARKGDCLMLHYGSPDDPRLVMIDGGPSGVYQGHLRPRIQAIRAARGLEDDQPLPVDLLMLSHVDDDHVKGLLELTRELIDAEMSHRPRLVQILGLWHNSFDNLTGNPPDQLLSGMQDRFGPASTEGALPDDADLEVDDLDPKEVHASLRVLASIPQGAQLRRDAGRLGIEINGDFDEDLIIAGDDLDPLPMGGGLTFTVVGPLKPEVEALHAKHEAWLRGLERAGKTPEEVLSAYIDGSEANLSSLVLLARSDAETGGKTMLLTGDARGDKVLAGLRLLGLLGAEDDAALHVDVLKVPHHGSAHNLEVDFFRRVTADHYVFSGDGEHGNPEREALEMLLEARGDAPYTLHFTYPIDEIDVEREKDWQQQQAREEKRKQKKPKVVVRPDWSPRQHSLTALFADHPAFGAKVKVAEGGQPYVIDVLDPVGF